MTVLKMTAPAAAGQFVKTLRGETGTGFAEGTHVHKDWWAKTISFDEAMEIAEDAARQREDVLAKIADITPKVNDAGQFVFAAGGKEFVPTDHALEQFAIRVGVPSSSVMRELRNEEGSDTEDAETMVKLAVNSIRKLKEDKVFRLRTYTDGTCRAFLTEKYAPVDNRWYLETLREFLPSARLSHWRGDEDSLYGNLILPDSVIDYSGSDDSDYGGMISVGNCEIGLRTVSQRPSLFRSICMNGCIWGEVKGKRIKRRHVGTIDLNELKIEIAENIASQIPLLDTGVRKFLELQKMVAHVAVNMKAIVGVVCNDYKIGKTEATKVWEQWGEHEEQHHSLFGAVNALTRAGQLLDNASWVKFDEIAGQLIETTNDRWSVIVKRAESYQEADYLQTFGVAV